MARRLVDRQFCSDAHRMRARQVYSARAARDLAFEENFEDGWIARINAPAQRKQSTFGPGSGVVLVVLTTLLLMFMPSAPDQPSAPSYLAPAGISDRISKIFPAQSAFAMREDFRVDLRNWQGSIENAVADQWRKVGNAVQIGELRLWKPTLALADYNMEFAAQIEDKAVGWAVRASDVNNYYATKISVAPGTDKRAEIVRYAMVGGRPFSRTRLPIPLAIAQDTVYEVKVKVKGDRFTTVVNGQMVDSWSDQRLAKGGVGFFNDPGERARLHWVSVSERESLLQRFLSFSLLTAPHRIE